MLVIDNAATKLAGKCNVFVPGVVLPIVSEDEDNQVLEQQQSGNEMGHLAKESEQQKSGKKQNDLDNGDDDKDEVLQRRHNGPKEMGVLQEQGLGIWVDAGGQKRKGRALIVD